MKNEKLYRFFIFMISVSLTVFLQIGFWGGFIGGLDFFNLVLIMIMIIFSFFGFGFSLSFAMVAGFWLDLYSDLPFGLFVMSFFITTVIMETLLINFFTDRFLYSIIAIGLISVIIYNVIFVLLSNIFFIFGASDFNLNFGFWRNLFGQLLVSAVIIPVCFVVIDKKSKIFKPVFLKS